MKTPARDNETGRFIKKDINYKKKTCTCCGKYLYLREFGKRSDRKNFPDGHDAKCKECRAKQRRSTPSYKKLLTADGIRMASNGVVVIHEGYSTRIYWSEEKKREFRKAFPFNTNEDLAIDFECSPRTIVRRAREMKLEKDPEWLHKIYLERIKMAHRVNRACGNKADLTNFLEASKAHRFKPGQGNGLTPEQNSERMKKAWVTRHRNMIRQKYQQQKEAE